MSQNYPPVSRRPSNKYGSVYDQKIEKYLDEVCQIIPRIPVSEISRVVEIIRRARGRGNRIIIMGNGGSASTASHFVCDLAKNLRQPGLRDFRAFGITDNMAMFSAYANDEGYENVFWRQMSNIVEEDDIVIGISTSGESENVVRGVNYANNVGAYTIGFSGFDGGRLGRLVDLNVNVPSGCVEQIEDIHLMFEHMIIRTIRETSHFEIPSAPRTGELGELSSMIKLMPMTAHIQEADTSSQTQVRRDIAEILYTINRKMIQGTDLQENVIQLLGDMTMNFNASGGSVLILDDKGSLYRGATTYEGEIAEPKSSDLTDIVSNGLARWVIDHDEPTLIESTRDDPRWMKREWEEQHEIPKSAISAPFKLNGDTLGVMTLTRSKSARFNMSDLALLSAIAFCISIFCLESGSVKHD